MILPNEYSLTLSTGERLDFSEYDSGRFPILESVADMALVRDILERCAVMSREDVESAKRGWDAVLRVAMRDPLSGLLKILRPVCVHAGDCIMVDKPVCTARNVSGRKGIPPCFEHDSAGSVQAIVTSIVFAWASKRRVIVVVPDPRALLSALLRAARPLGSGSRS